MSKRYQQFSYHMLIAWKRDITRGHLRYKFANHPSPPPPLSFPRDFFLSIYVQGTDVKLLSSDKCWFLCKRKIFPYNGFPNRTHVIIYWKSKYEYECDEYDEFYSIKFQIQFPYSNMLEKIPIRLCLFAFNAKLFFVIYSTIRLTCWIGILPS